MMTSSKSGDQDSGRSVVPATQETLEPTPAEIGAPSKGGTPGEQKVVPPENESDSKPHDES